LPASRIAQDGVTALEMAAEAHQDRAFEDLVAPLVPAAQRLAYGMLQNGHEAEDAVQEATFKAWRAFPRFREGSNARLVPDHRRQRVPAAPAQSLVVDHAAGRARE